MAQLEDSVVSIGKRNVTINGNSDIYAGIFLNNVTSGSQVRVQNWINSAAIESFNVADDVDNRRSLFIKNSGAVANVSSALTLRDYIDGVYTEYKIYGEHNKPTPADIGAATASHNHSAGEITSGTLAVARGGTGQTTAKAAANALINALETGSSKPADNDYYISQYVNGGTTTTTYHRRPISKLWEYMKDKTDGLYLQLTGGTLTGQLNISSSEFGILTINRTTEGRIPGIGFKHQGTLTGYLGMNSEGQFVRYDSSGSNGKRILDAENYSNYALPLAGGTLTGNVFVNKNGNPYYGLQDGTNTWYFQSVKADNAMYIGAGTAKSLKIDINGNTTVKGNFTAQIIYGTQARFSENIYITTGENNRFIVWDYSTESSKAGASWRIGMLGTGSSDANYFVIQTTGSSTGTSETFANAIRIGMDTKNVLLSSTTASTSKTTGALVVSGGIGVSANSYFGNIYADNIIPSEAGTGAIGQSGIPWLNMHTRRLYFYDTNLYNIGELEVGYTATAEQQGTIRLVLGTNVAGPAVNSYRGYLRLYDSTNFYAQITPVGNLTADRTIYLPDQGGSLLTTSNGNLNREVLYKTANVNYSSYVVRGIAAGTSGSPTNNGNIFIKY